MAVQIFSPTFVDMDVLKFLIDNRKYFTLSDIEQAEGIPQSTLNKALTGRRELTDEHKAKIRNYIKKLHSKIEKFLNQ